MAAIATSGIQQAYDRPDIKRITISKYLEPTKRIDITPQVITLDIFESIQHSTVFCDIGINDGIGFSQDKEAGLGDLVGEEVVDIEFVTTGDSEPVQYKFFVNSVKRGIPSNQSTGITFFLSCVSVDFIKSFNTWVSKGYNDTYDNVVKDILQNIMKTDLPVDNIDQTKGTHKIVIPKLNALNAVDFIRTRSVAINKESSPFLFFQNKRGYNFKSLASLLESPQQKITKYVYGDMSTKHSGVSDRFYSIISMSNDKRFDVLSKVKEGVLNNTIQQFDIITKKIDITRYEITDHANKFTFKNTGSFNSTKFLDEFGKGTGTSFFYVVDSDRPETFFSSSLGPKTAYAYLMHQNMVSIEVFGNSDLTAGDLIQLDVDHQVSTSDERVADKFLSGYFLIHNLRHNIVFDTAGPHHTTYCTLLKGDTTGRNVE